MWPQIKAFISPRANDPDEFRRNRLLNILSLGILISALVGFLATLVYMIVVPEAWASEDARLMLLSFPLSVSGSRDALALYVRSSTKKFTRAVTTARQRATIRMVLRCCHAGANSSCSFRTGGDVSAKGMLMGLRLRSRLILLEGMH